MSAVNSPIHLLFSQEVVRRGLDSSEALEAQQGAATGQQKAKLDVRKVRGSAGEEEPRGPCGP